MIAIPLFPTGLVLAAVLIVAVAGVVLLVMKK